MAPSKFYGFTTFAEQGYGVSLNGVFRDNVREFLQQCAEPEDYSVDGMPVWRTLLVYESKGIVLPLFTVEEDVKFSDRPFCDFCRCVGWSQNFVSRRKYHLIIPADDEWNKPLDENAFDLQTHLLHGLIHCNGFGHVICINGIEGGSKHIPGRETMDLWDRICTTLHARRITVEDLSTKHMMELRLLYAVAYGQSWFGRWGYRFCRGSFGVKEHDYERAIGVLSNMELNQVIDEFNSQNGLTLINQIINGYRDQSGADLVTVRDLFKFVLGLKSESPPGRTSATSSIIPSWSGRKIAFAVPIKRYSLRVPIRRAPKTKTSISGKEKSEKFRKFSNVAARMESRWPVRRLEHVAEVIVEALREKKAEKGPCSCGMTRQEARDAARLYIGDTGLIDHVLKAMNNVIVGNYIIRRAVNHSSKVLEYTIQDLNKGAPIITVAEPIKAPSVDLGRNVYDVLAYLYTNVLLEYPGVKAATRTILHSKHFVKDWPFRDEDDHCLRFICRLTRSALELTDEISQAFLPREYIVVQPYATIGDLKIAVQNALRSTYCVMENLFVTDIVGMEGEDDGEVLFGVVESGSEIFVRGCGLDLETDLRCEGGVEKWTVKCKCGALDDDGERMVSCDICEAWQHTLCAGIEDAESVPRFFICDMCCGSLAPPEQMEYGYEFGLDDPYPDPMMENFEPQFHEEMLYCE